VGVDWIRMAHERGKWLTLGNTVMNRLVHKRWEFSWLAERLFLNSDSAPWS
jgi:hypothetical protein